MLEQPDKIKNDIIKEVCFICLNLFQLLYCEVQTTLGQSLNKFYLPKVLLW